MARQLKRWESPRREGRNSKGKGGTARLRQIKKQVQQLRQKLKTDHPQREVTKLPPVFVATVFVLKC